MEDYKKIIQNAIFRALNSDDGGSVSDIKAEEINVETSLERFGDYTTNVAMQSFGTVPTNIKGGNVHKHASSISGTSQMDTAKNILERLHGDNELLKFFEKIEIAGPGFINFWLKKDTLVDNLMHIDTLKEDFGKSDEGKGKTIVVDYSSPNIAKPFGIGHLRSTVIGQSIYNLYKFLGFNVIGDNHLGDWGTQFGKLLYMIDYKKTKDLSIENLEKLYVEFHVLAKDDDLLESKAREWFKKLEDGDVEARTLWKQCINVSLNEFKRIYDLLNVKIDNAFGESFYEEEMKEMLSDPKITKYLEDGEDGSSKVINLNKVGIKTPLMFLKSDGATTYATRDLATIQFRQKKYKPDTIIYEVGGEQKLHFEQVFAAAKILKIVDPETKLIHTAHGLYLAPDGKKFSTRNGKTIKLEEVLDEAIERAWRLSRDDSRRKEDIKNNESHKSNKFEHLMSEEDARKASKIIGIGAIKYFDLMHSVQSSVVFDWEKIMNMEGNSGPYLQYTVARINSIVEKSKANKLEVKNIELNEEELSILRKLSQFHEIIVSAAKSYSPNILCNYLYDLASKLNTFYNKHKVIGSGNEAFRVILVKATGQVLKNGLNILGIETPKSM